VSRYQKGKTRKVKTNLDLLEQEIVSGSGIGYIQDNHANIPPLSFLQAGCPSCRPTNSVKALKEVKSYKLCSKRVQVYCAIFSKFVPYQKYIYKTEIVPEWLFSSGLNMFGM